MPVSKGGLGDRDACPPQGWVQGWVGRVGLMLLAVGELAGAEGPALLQGWQTSNPVPDPDPDPDALRVPPSGALRSHGPADQEAPRKNKMRETHGRLMSVDYYVVLVVLSY